MVVMVNLPGRSCGISPTVTRGKHVVAWMDFIPPGQSRAVRRRLCASARTRKEVPMMVSATSGIVRIMGIWVRRADAGLVAGAARNAAASMADHRARRLDEIRALHDLQALLQVDPPGTRTGPPDGPTSHVG
jgi:hypothetical protein